MTRAKTINAGACGGVTDLQGILDRCRVDRETGCWVWSLCTVTASNGGSPVPRTTALGVSGITAIRAAWLLSGRKLAAGQVVWRHQCGNALCCNPEHMKAGTRREMRQACAASGREKGLHRQIANRAKAVASATPAEKVRAAEALLNAGMPRKEVVQALSINRDTVRKIANGQHMHSAGRAPAVRAASVFSWGGA